MSNENIQRLRSEFINLASPKYEFEVSATISGVQFTPSNIEEMFRGFLLAKHSQKPVKLPRPDVFTLIDDEKPDLKSHTSESIKRALQDAGVPYTQE
jgi:hypothetical protein